jgi:hypothetical protein
MLGFNVELAGLYSIGVFIRPAGFLFDEQAFTKNNTTQIVKKTTING